MISHMLGSRQIAMWEVLGFSLLQGTHVAEDIFFARSPAKIYPPAWTVDDYKPLNQHSSVDPEILATTPVFILGRSKLKLQELAANTAVLIDIQPGLQKFPTTIDDLGAWLTFDNLFRARHLVALHFHILGRNPAELCSYFHALLLMYDTITQDIRYLELVALGRVGV